MADEAARAHFLGLLAAAAGDPRSRVRVVITLRADYYDRPLHYPDFGELLRRQMVTVLPLSAEELQRAIVRPAEQVGVRYEEGLAAAIIDDTLYQPGALPLLQYALTELFEQREGRLLTRGAYDALGGVTGALARRAEELYQEQEEEGREVIRQMFLRLVALDDDAATSPDTRRRVPRSELVAVAPDEELMDEIVDTYAAYRLLTLDHDPDSRSPTVEVAHEALLREWERLRRWIEDSREDLYQHRRLQTLAGDWLENGHVPGLLLRETRLDQFAAWAANTNLALTGDERAFLEASVEARQDRRAEEEARRQRELETAQKLAQTEHQRAEEQAQAVWRLRWLAVGLAVILAVAIGTSLLAWTQSQRAARQARLATARELAAAALSNLDVDPERSILLALQATETTHAVDGTVLPEAEDALHQAVQASRIQFTAPSAGAVAYSPNGAWLATSTGDGAVLWDATGGEKVLTLSGHSEAVNNLIFSADGSRLATTGNDKTARVWDTATGELLQTLSGHTEGLISATFSPDGNLLATSSWDRTVRVWDTRSGARLRTFFHRDATVGLDFSPDGAWLAVAVDSTPGAAYMWNIPSGALLTLTGHSDGVNDVAFSADGTRLATVSTDGTAKVWDVAGGEPSAPQPLLTMFQGAWVFGVDFSPDGSRIATGGQDGVAKVWDVASGAEVLSLPVTRGPDSRVNQALFNSDSTRLVTASADGTAKVWDISTALGGGPAPQAPLLTLSGHTGIVWDVAFSPDESRLATAGFDGLIKVWYATTGEELLSLSGQPIGPDVAFSPDGSYLAAGSA